MNDYPTHVFRPSVRAYGKGVGVQAALVLPVLAVLIALNRDKPLLVAILAVVAAACFGGVLLYIAVARVYVTESRIGRRGFGPTRWVEKAAVQRSLFVRDLRVAGAASQSVLFLFAPDGARVMRFSGDLWAEEDLHALAAATGAEASVRALPTTTTDLAAEEPTALNWLETHPKETVWITVGVFVAIAVPIAVAVVTAQ